MRWVDTHLVYTIFAILHASTDYNSITMNSSFEFGAEHSWIHIDRTIAKAIVDCRETFMRTTIIN